jgi:hypothetical protein
MDQHLKKVSLCVSFYVPSRLYLNNDFLHQNNLKSPTNDLSTLKCPWGNPSRLQNFPLCFIIILNENLSFANINCWRQASSAYWGFLCFKALFKYLWLFGTFSFVVILGFWMLVLCECSIKSRAIAVPISSSTASFEVHQENQNSVLWVYPFINAFSVNQCMKWFDLIWL